MSLVDPRLAASLADRYRLERELGAGGMATVYLAHDIKHDRRVAIKVLRPELAAVIGAARFLAEIKTTANLSHPHILPLHDSGEVDGTVFYVMPFVDGESLRDKLDREQQLPVDEATRIAVEVAGALAYAHEHQVIHRDIKPENILLHGGHAMVADFGIALAASRTDGKIRMTETGMSLGTPHYMSPEQAMGEREITARADVYALGCVLYEMLVGEPPFNGPTAQAIVARVMTEEPRSLTTQRRTVPHHVDAAVTRALSKLPADRFATAANFADALTNPALTSVQGAVALPLVPRRRWPAVATAALVAGTGVLAYLGGRVTAPTDARLVFADIPVVDSYPAVGRCCGVALAISPAGDKVVYVGNSARGSSSQIFLRRLDRPEAIPIAGTTDGSTPFFSPDGQWLGFYAEGRLRKVSILGGPSVPIVAVERSSEAAWGTDGRILYIANNHILSVSADGGTPDTVLRAESGQARFGVSRAPGDRWAVFASRTLGSVQDNASIVLLDLRDGTTKNLGAGMRAIFASDYLLTTARDNTLTARRFDRRTGTLSEAGVPLTENVMLHGATTHEFAASAEGTLLFQRGGGASSSGDALLRFTQGTATVVDLPLTGYRNLEDVSVSPDGKRLLVHIFGAQALANAEAWIFTPDQGTLERLSVGGARESAWSRSGSEVAYIVERALMVRNADGTGEPRVVARGDIHAPSWLPGDRGLVFARADGNSDKPDLYRIDFPDTLARPVVTSPFAERQPQVSPDGAWLAYSADVSGTVEVYVQSLSGQGPRVRVSPDGGDSPRWSPDGRTLYYVRNAALIAAVRAAGASFTIESRSTIIPSGVSDINPSNSNWSVHPDGKTFLFISFDAGMSTGSLSVVRNWQQLMVRRDAPQ
jgi:Tol biopolymer transport system component/tRNA A-37 threonylcarbamoyl transferase component Bud32